MRLGLSFVLLWLGAWVAVESIDCRKFAFAPACRGVMVKRGDSDSAEALIQQLRSEVAQLTVVVGRLHQSQAEDCAALTWLRQQIQH